VAVEVSVGERLRAVLLAPWEGRPLPSPAELTLFTLLGQHAATAIDHALLYAQLRRQTDELDRLAGVQRDFLRGVSHDLQTPLTSIGALASELRASPATDDTAAADLEMIEHQADRLRRMVGQLLVVSRLEAGAIQPRQEVFRPEPIVQRTWVALRPVQRELALRSTGDYLAVGDPDRFEQVAWAVLDNAVKYGAPGSPVEVRIVSSDAAGPTLEISVTDQGIGMDVDAQAHATEQFYRSGEARNLVPDGSGIGLYAAKGLMEAMSGDLRIESRLGEGTTVTLSLPAERATAEADTSAPAATA
jgi:signal transduction histidine kinase